MPARTAPRWVASPKPWNVLALAISPIQAPCREAPLPNLQPVSHQEKWCPEVRMTEVLGRSWSGWVVHQPALAGCGRSSSQFPVQQFELRLAQGFQFR